MFSRRSSAVNSRKSSVASRRTSTSSRRKSIVSVIEDIDTLYNLKEFRRLTKLNEESSPTNTVYIDDDDDTKEEGSGYFTCDCYIKLKKKKWWKPFISTVFFLLHFILVMLVLFGGAYVLSQIEDPVPVYNDDTIHGNEPVRDHIAHTNQTQAIRNVSKTFWEILVTNYKLNISDEKEQKVLLDFVRTHIEELDEAEYKAHRLKHSEDRWFVFLKWVYFVTVACTTIGYGDVVPETNNGRFFYIIFSIIGIPLMMSLLKSCGKLITAINKKFFRFINECCCDENPMLSEELLSALSILILFCGYIAAGCLFNAAVAGWPLFESIYFLIVTFTTVGFGDIKHDLDTQAEYFIPLLVYRVFGLAMLAGVIDSLLQYLVVRKVDLKKQATLRERQFRVSRIMMEKKFGSIRNDVTKKLSKHLHINGSAIENNDSSVAVKRENVQKDNSIDKTKRMSTLSVKSSNNRNSFQGLTFDARVHEPIFGTGPLDEQSYGGSSSIVSFYDSSSSM